MDEDCSQSYFPVGSLDVDPGLHRFLAEYFTSALTALDERPLSSSSVMQPPTIRLLCLPTWCRACSISVQLATLPNRITWCELDGPEAGFELGTLAYRSERVLSRNESTRLTIMWDYLKFWDLPAGIDEYVLDGTFYVLEGRESSRYHVVRRANSEWGDTFEEFTNLLFTISGISPR